MWFRHTPNGGNDMDSINIPEITSKEELFNLQKPTTFTIYTTNNVEYISLAEISKKLSFERANLGRLVRNSPKKISSAITIKVKTKGGSQLLKCILKSDLEKLLLISRLRCFESDDKGYVYIVIFDNRYIKIGQSKTRSQRIMSYKTLPFEVEIIAVIKTENRFKTEKRLHTLFKEHHVKNEFFNCKGIITKLLFNELLEEGEEWITN